MKAKSSPCQLIEFSHVFKASALASSWNLPGSLVNIIKVSGKIHDWSSLRFDSEPGIVEFLDGNWGLDFYGLIPRGGEWWSK